VEQGDAGWSGVVPELGRRGGPGGSADHRSGGSVGQPTAALDRQTPRRPLVRVFSKGGSFESPGPLLPIWTLIKIPTSFATSSKTSGSEPCRLRRHRPR
jgi:hypothetical protein